MTTCDNGIEEISQTLISLMPQKSPFLFVDRIAKVDSASITGQVALDPSAWFYQGHFPGHPITPGVILLEAMAQTGVVAFGIYLQWLSEGLEKPPRFNDILTLFSDVKAEFRKVVMPGELLTIQAEKTAFRRQKLICEVMLYNAQGELAAVASLAGVGVKRHG